MLEMDSSSPRFKHSSTPIPKDSFGRPYANLQELARRLATGLEDRANASQCLSERKRLGVLAATASRISQCLANTGVKI